MGYPNIDWPKVTANHLNIKLNENNSSYFLVSSLFCFGGNLNNDSAKSVTKSFTGQITINQNSHFIYRRILDLREIIWYSNK